MVQMVFENLCDLVPWTKVASALDLEISDKIIMLLQLQPSAPLALGRRLDIINPLMLKSSSRNCRLDQ